MTNPLLELKKYGQSVWYDNLNRELLDSGRLQRMVEEDGVSGGTSNPSIFEKAVAGGSYYDAGIRRLAGAGKSVEEIYDELTIADVQGSADVFRPVYDETAGADGYASLEVSPTLAYDAAGTIEAARRLFAALDRPNAMIKIPGTQEGLPAVEQCLFEGININITLLFGVENYEQVARACVSALERRLAAGKPIDRIASVASFFVSRVDTICDDRLQRRIAGAGSETEREQLKSLLGKAAIANAKIAYAKYKQIFSGARWHSLVEAGARPQRCLWASTSTKNPDYRDVMYVEELIGTNTVNTLPQSTVDAFRDHGLVANTLEPGIAEAFETIHDLERAGIDFKGTTDELQVQGVNLFADSFHQANETIRQKQSALARRSSAVQL